MKEKVRNEFISIRKNMDKIEVERKSRIIIQKLQESKEYINAQEVFTYVSNFNEVDTIELIEYSLKCNKKVAVPKSYKEGIMIFYYISSLDDLEKGYFDILEPKTSDKAIPLEHTLLVIPGVSFDISKNRIGFGGGYYDKFLANHDSVNKVAVCYDYQIIDHIITDNYDVPMDKIISEKRIIN